MKAGLDYCNLQQAKFYSKFASNNIFKRTRRSDNYCTEESQILD